jgi:hypothetical protein
MLTYTCPRIMIRACILSAALLFSVVAHGQNDGDADAIKPVPILTGSAAYFTQVDGGAVKNVPSVSPLLLVPLGDKWLIEAKGNYSDTFVPNGDEKDSGDVYGSSYGLGYAQVDYIANRFLTVSAGRFITPFGVYAERQFPNWIRTFQVTPLTVPITSGSSLGGMLRGGFPAGSKKVDLNYALYFSTANTNHLLTTARSTGGRIGFFLPGPRLEIGASFQQILQSSRPHAAGFHLEWQPNALPLTLRSEYAHSSGRNGSAYWIESVYRFSKVPYLRRLELAARAQQFFADPNLTPAQITGIGALGLDTNQGDFGVNYYLNRDVRVSASYGREFVLGQDANLWVAGITYRFIMPLGPQGGAL